VKLRLAVVYSGTKEVPHSCAFCAQEREAQARAARVFDFKIEKLARSKRRKF
jgi:hypothetical protein